MQKFEKPEGYPYTYNSGIYDARAFRIGKSETVHLIGHFPDGDKVVAKCGAYGYANDYSGYRVAEWADSFETCRFCKNGS